MKDLINNGTQKPINPNYVCGHAHVDCVQSMWVLTHPQFGRVFGEAFQVLLTDPINVVYVGVGMPLPKETFGTCHASLTLTLARQLMTQVQSHVVSAWLDDGLSAYKGLVIGVHQMDTSGSSCHTPAEYMIKWAWLDILYIMYVPYVV